jgi:DHA1 family bicyclomycin/chloramphenicol resistance-like MFS transporter
MSSKGISLAKPGTRHLTVVAALLSMIGPFSIDAYLPSFPDIELEFGISRAMLSQSLAVYLLAFAFSTLAWGPLADRFGRRLVIILSMTLYTLGSIGCALASNNETFLLLRIVQGFAASGGFIAGRAMIRDAHDAESAHRAMAQVTLLFALAPAIAPVLGGWLHDHFGWRSVFWFLSLFGSMLVLMGFFIKETLVDEHRRSIHPAAVARVYFSALTHRQFPALVLSFSLGFAGLFLYIAGAPTVIYDFLGLGGEDFGWLFIPIVVGLVLGASVSSRLAHRWPVQRTISAGLLMMILAALLNISAVSLGRANILFVIGPLVFYVIGLALMMPAITVLALDCLPTHRGTAASMQGFLQSITNAAVASFAVPLLSGRWLNFVLGQIVFLLFAVTLWYRIGRTGMESNQKGTQP